MATALGIAPDSEGNGVTPLVHRQTIKAHWVNTGVVTGLTVTGQSNLYYKVAAGVGVCSRGSSDGCTEAYFAGGTVATTAGSSSSPRYDVIYIKANDLTQGDSDNTVTLGVVQGTPATSPSIPSLPTGAIACDTRYVPAGMTVTSSTSTTGNRTFAVPYGASLGVLANMLVTHNANWTETGETSIMNSTFTLPTDRYVGFKYTVTAGANGGTMTDGDGSVYVGIYVDNVLVEKREIRLRATGSAVSSYFELYGEFTAGTHAVKVTYTKNACTSLRMYYQSKTWAGQHLMVVDMGVAD